MSGEREMGGGGEVEGGGRVGRVLCLFSSCFVSSLVIVL